MITLDGLTISDNMYLGGIETAESVSISQVHSNDGIVTTFAKPITGGEKLTLGTTTGSGGSTQGFWCKGLVDQINYIKSYALPVELNYHGEVHNVLIVSTSGLKQWDNREILSDKKAYVGQITLLKV